MRADILDVESSDVWSCMLDAFLLRRGRSSIGSNSGGYHLPFTVRPLECSLCRVGMPFAFMLVLVFAAVGVGTDAVIFDVCVVACVDAACAAAFATAA